MSGAPSGKIDASNRADGAIEDDRAAAPTEDLGNWRGYSVLIVDDEEGMRSFLERALRNRCGLVEAVASVELAAGLQSRVHFDLIVLDIALPGMSGIDWLNELRANGFAGDVVLITAFADMEMAINALRGGASDFILKPFRLDQLLNAIKRCFERSRLSRENFILRRTLAGQGDQVPGLVGQSEPVRQLRAMVHRVAPMPSTVLLAGESGTGKEVLARALHQLSARAQSPFVPVNCAAISPELIESELFGHVKGAFTGASEGRNGLFYYAHGGTLFLDEIGELPLSMQTKLLRAIEERRVRPVGSEKEVPVDVRIIAATNRDLAAEAAAGRFRQDLYFRIAVVELRLPPLRERLADIPSLVQHFMAALCSQLGVAPLALTHAQVQRLSSYVWPGNVRELKNYVERSLILGTFPDLGGNAAMSAEPPPEGELTLAELERRHALQVLDRAGGNKSEAARRLGISRKTLERKCTEWGREPGT